MQALTYPAASIKNSLNAPSAPFCTTENSKRQQRQGNKRKARGQEGCVQHLLLACVGSLHAHSNEMDLVTAEPYASGKQREV